MKEIRIFLIAILAGVLVSCSKDGVNYWVENTNVETVYVDTLYVKNGAISEFDNYNGQTAIFSLDRPYPNSYTIKDGIYYTTLYDIIIYPLTFKSEKQLPKIIDGYEDTYPQWFKYDGNELIIHIAYPYDSLSVKVVELLYESNTLDFINVFDN